MSKYDYDMSKVIGAQDPTFYSLIMAAMRKADTANATLLRTVFPGAWDELQARYNAPGGLLAGERAHMLAMEHENVEAAD